MIEELIEAYKAAEIAKKTAWSALKSALIEAAPWKVGDKIEHVDYWKRTRIVRITKVYASIDDWREKTYVAKSSAYPVNKDGSTSKIGKVTVEYKDKFTILESGDIDEN